MTEVGNIWIQAAAKWDEVAAQIGDGDMDKPSTCDDWTVKDLVEHAMQWQATGGSALGAETNPDDDWPTVAAAISATLADPSNLEGTVEAFGGMPKQSVAGFVIGDLLIHSWDLARSLGVDDTLPAEAVESTLMGLQRVPEEMLRGPNMFGPALEAAADASPQEQLIAFVGRQA